MAKDINNPAAIDQFIQNLQTPLAQLVQTIRQVILSTDPVIGEQIKWNSPSFFYQGDMQSFDAKEYKRDMIVLNLRQKDHVLLIFPTGAKVISPIFEGNYTDGRRMVKIYNHDDLKTKKVALQTVVKEWLKFVHAD